MDQLRALRVFTRVIDEGSLAAAARALALAPAVVTRVLAELETHLGARLLNRSSRRLALTDAGAAYLAREALRDGRLERVLPQWQGSSLTLYATLPSRRHLPARTRVFVDFLVESFGGEARDPWLRDEAGPDQRL